MGNPPPPPPLSVSLLLSLLIFIPPAPGVGATIGVNYGRVANNLPPPGQVVQFLLSSTIINRVRLFDADPETLLAFAHTGIAVTITLPNDAIPALTNNLTAAHQWVRSAVSPLVAGGTNIIRILVGNEVLSTGNKLLILSLVPSMQALHTALSAESLDQRIQVSTPHSLGLLSVSTPPSSGRFRPGYDTHVIRPLLGFLRATGSPFMVNPYPFFGCSPQTLDFALFRSSAQGPWVFDEASNRNYTNMFDAQLDAVFSAMSASGFGDVNIVIAETGWPSSGDPGQVGVDPESAAEYNTRVIQHVSSGVGTPLMPNRSFETYIFAMFDENLKPGPTCERYFGLFKPDLAPSYNAGVLRQPTPTNHAPDLHGSLLIITLNILLLLSAHVATSFVFCET